MVGIDLSGKVALVTGASRGLGRAAAVALARAGADVAVNFLKNRRAAAAVTATCRKYGAQAFAVRADVASAAQVRRMFELVVRRFGRLDILVANAGIWKEAPIDRMTDRQIEEMLGTNVRGVFYCCREASRIMVSQRSGRIVLVSSTAGQRGEPLHSHYAASKGAVISLTKSLAPELAQYGVLVNCIAPGWFATDMSRSTMTRPARRRAVLQTIPLGRIGRPDEFAGAVLFLCSDLATFVTGEILNVNGGAVLCG
ncbi:MAG: glucose 1-dehydrogenase [candidate division WOR-3 bacterium]